MLTKSIQFLKISYNKRKEEDIREENHKSFKDIK